MYAMSAGRTETTVFRTSERHGWTFFWGKRSRNVSSAAKLHLAVSRATETGLPKTRVFNRIEFSCPYEHVVSDFLEHHHQERNRQGKDNLLRFLLCKIAMRHV